MRFILLLVFFLLSQLFYQLLLYSNQKYIAINSYSFFLIRQNHIRTFLFALHTIEFYRNIRDLQNIKERMLLKKNSEKFRIIIFRKNEHLVFFFSFFFLSRPCTIFFS